MKRLLLLSFACSLAMVGVISTGGKRSTEDETYDHNLGCLLHHATTTEERAQLLKEMVSQCDSGRDLSIVRALDGSRQDSKATLRYFDGLSSSDFKVAKEIAAQKAPSNDLCLTIANKMLELANKAGQAEIIAKMVARVEGQELKRSSEAGGEKVLPERAKPVKR